VEVALYLFWADNLNIQDRRPPWINPSMILELRRKELFRRMENLGDFRRGTISLNYRKCGKKNCACARKDHPRHGPQYL
jgi:hypothetical protein